jgi:serine/threonine-protein kinase
MWPKARDYEPGESVPGTVYRVVRRIGSGGMGTVYEVEDTTIAKRYVLKTLLAQLGTRDDLVRRMQNEARTLARLNHPNIVDVVTAGVTDDQARLPYYVMERLNGQSLRTVLEKKWQLELPHAFHIAIDLLDALDHAHDKGVIHRDVKPDNIYLHRTAAGVTVTKLLDFGIMSLLDATAREAAGRFLGTLRYAAPEQLRGERPTPKVDIYAAGLVLYEMIAGRGPFDDEGDSHRIAAAHLHKMPTPISRYVPVPKELDALLLAVLAKEPEARPRDAFALAASLRNLKRAHLAAQNGDGGKGRAEAGGASAEPPRSTQSGMSPPTVGLVAAPPAAPGAEDPRGGGASVVDRAAPTGSLVPPTPRLPREGTDAFAPTFPASQVALAEPTPPPVTLPTPDTPLPALGERFVLHSDAPQVRSVAAPAAPLKRSAVVVMVSAIAVSLFLASAAIFVVASHQSAGKEGPAAAEPVGSVVSRAPLAAAGVPAMQAQPPQPAAQTVPSAETMQAPDAGPGL